ncbi:MAG: HEPN domain-containing protein [Chloroflexia bacterium]
MNTLTAEWVEKAEGDFATAEREVAVLERPNYDAVCFHTQQSAEKYLKGFLQEQGVTFPKTHELIELLELCLPCDSDFETLRNSLRSLNRYAVNYRYPRMSANKDEAREAVKDLKAVRTFTRKKLGLT